MAQILCPTPKRATCRWSPHGELWEYWRQDFIIELEQKNSERFFLIDFLLYEKMVHRAFEYVLKEDSLTFLVFYQNKLSDYNPELYFKAYQKLIPEQIKNTKNRSGYDLVAGYLRVMKKLPGKGEEFLIWIKYLKKEFGYLPLLTEILNEF